MWPDTRLTDLLGIEHPILQAPMLGTCTPELAAAVSAAGGLGAYACGLEGPREVAARAHAVARATNAPVNLNFFVLKPENRVPEDGALATLARWYEKADLGALPDFPPAPTAAPSDDVIDVICKAAPRVVSFHFGVPGPEALAALREAGSVILSTATTVAEAQALQAAGVDAIIAQGWEAGGHRGSHKPTLPGEGVGTMALVPQIVDAVDLPVIAAGGIGDARGIAAAFALGASGVQMGSAFLGCPEAATKPAHLDALSGASDAGTIMTDAVSGRVARAAVTPYAQEMAVWAGKLPEFPNLYTATRPLVEAGAAGFSLFGQAASLRRHMPAGELVHQLAVEAQALMRGFSGAPRG